jgi:ADP-heptose:LPS heptosyltransferase
MIEKVKKILVINLGGIGDILLSLPSIKALKNKFPYAKICILIIPRVYEVIKNSSCVDEIFLFRKGINFFWGDLRTLFFLRKEHFDLAINMRTLVSKSSAKKIKLVMDIIKPKIRVGRDTQGLGYFFDIKVPETLIGQKWELEYDIDTVKALKADVFDKNIDLKIDEESISRLNKILEKENVDKETVLIGIHPGGMPSRRWPIENFAKMINKIYKELNCQFVITGGKDEIELVNRLKKITNTKVINLAGRINFDELLALIKQCNIFISNDTAPMHIAAILKTPLVALLGPGDIKRYDPRYISGQVVVLYKKVDCSPCNKLSCKELKCLKIISPEEVVERVLGLLRPKD